MENEFSKSFYKIKDVSEMLDLPQSTIRYWEKEFPNDVKPIRNSGRTRYFTPSDIEALQIIKYLIHNQGLKTEAARQQMKLNRKNISRRLEIIQKLRGVRSTLQQMLDSLKLRK